LIEILVAFSIASVALAIMFQIYSKGTHSAILGKEYSEAVTIAESRLDELGLTLAMDSGGHQGLDLGKYHWSIRIEDFQTDTGSDTPTPFELKSVRIDVSWQGPGQQRSISLHSLKPYIAL